MPGLSRNGLPDTRGDSIIPTMDSDGAEPSNALPIACSLGAGGLPARQAELRTGVLSEALEADRLPDGVRWRFRDSPDLLARLGAVIDAERRCCRFLHFSMTADVDLGTVTLEVTGPPGTREFLETWIAERRR